MIATVFGLVAPVHDAAAQGDGITCRFDPGSGVMEVVDSGSPEVGFSVSQGGTSSISAFWTLSTSHAQLSYAEECRNPAGEVVATTLNTVDKIEVRDGRSLQLQSDAGGFQPGLDAEDGAPEIEITWHPLESAGLSLQTGSSSEPMNLRVGRTATGVGANLNPSAEAEGEADVDVLVTSHIPVGAQGSAGNDRASALGGPEFDGPLDTSFYADGNAGDDVLAGGIATNNLDGEQANDILIGGPNSDSIAGGLGDDAVAGGAGDDYFVGGFGADSIDGGDGRDRLDFNFFEVPVSVDLASPAPQITGALGPDTVLGIEDLRGGRGDDTLLGDNADNEIQAGPGDDRVLGAGGQDRLLGRGGSDRINGGPDPDVLIGGSDVDRLFARDGTPDLVLSCGTPRQPERVHRDDVDPRPLSC